MGTIQTKKDRYGITRYYARVRLKNKQDTNVFDSKSAAQLWIDETELNARKGNVGGTTADIRRMKIGAIFDAYIQKVKPNKDSEARCEMLRPSFGELPLEQLNSEILHDWLILMETSYPVRPRTKIVDGKPVKQPYAAATIRKFYMELRKVLVWHSKIKEYDFNSRPFDNNPPPGNWENVRSRVLEEDNGQGKDELQALIEACQKYSRKGNRVNLPQFLKFQHYSACRSGEALALTWQNLHFDPIEPQNSFITIPKRLQKTRKHQSTHERYLPLFPEFYEFVKETLIPRKGKPTERIFPFWKNSTQVSKLFKHARRNAQLVDKDICIHDFRHHSTTALFEKTGLTDLEISGITGHSQTSTLDRYRAVRVKKLNAKIWGSWKPT